jgi:hypothetical protein
LIVLTGGNVGIGDSSPDTLLELKRNMIGQADAGTDIVLTINNASTTDFDPYVNFQTASTTRWRLGVDDSDLDKFRLTPLNGAFSATSSGITVTQGGFVGIGTTDPSWAKLRVVSSSGSNSSTTLMIENTATTGDTVLEFRQATTTWYVGANVAQNRFVIATSSIDQDDTQLGSMKINWSTGEVVFGDGQGKIAAGTIDPVYTIGDTRYATYVASMLGVKEEMADVVMLAQTSEPNLFAYIIDFNSAGKGSDYWVFRRIVDWGSSMENLNVLLTSQSNSKVSYKKDPENNRIIIYGRCACEVSIRLSAPRFDHASWTNLAQGDATGFVVPDAANSTSTEPDYSTLTVSADWLEVEDLAVKYDDLEQRVAALEMKLAEDGTVQNTNDQNSPPYEGGARGGSEGFLASLTDALQSFGAKIQDGILEITQLIAKNITTDKLMITRSSPSASLQGAQSGNSSQELGDQIGEGVILQGATSTEVASSAIGVYDKVFVSSEKPIALGVSGKTAGQGFMVVVAEPAEEDIFFDWWIVGVKFNATSTEPVPGYTILEDPTADYSPDTSGDDNDTSNSTSTTTSVSEETSTTTIAEDITSG